jgi:putative Mg2+ transporter-C (MgtC) family protein
MSANHSITTNPFSHGSRSYFTKLTLAKGIFYLLAVAYVLLSCILMIIQPFLTIPCDLESIEIKAFSNPVYNDNPCRGVRYPFLLFLTMEECDFGRRLVVAVLAGGVIGWERRQSDRPAGIRTMALVSLGSCLFTICSSFAFMDGPMSWDASRVSAAIPSGVGFLGAGLIFKEQKKDEHGEDSHTVRGLTTAASLWLSAAVGIACGGQLYFVASFSIAIMLVLLRFGPRFDISVHPEDNASNHDPEMQPIYQPSIRSTEYIDHNSVRRTSKRIGRQATFSAD